jgi:oligosaccharide repeat unit polymerase
VIGIAQREIDEPLFQLANVRFGGSWCVWTAALAFFVGLSAFWSGQSWLLSPFLPAAYLAIVFAFVRTLQTWRDPFNPLCLVFIVGIVRFLLPGILILTGTEPDGEAMIVFQLMKLSDSDWEWANALALVGMLAAALGWLLIQMRPRSEKHLKFDLSESVKHASLVGMAIGAGALLLFVRTNASLDVIASGDFRGTTIQTGTGKYFFLAYLLIAGGVLLSCYLLAHGRTKLSMAPLVVTAFLYWVLGGRARAMTPIAAGLLLIWYYSREKKAWKKLALTPKHMAVGLLVPLCTVWLSYVGLMYRGETGIRAFSEALSVSGFSQYAKQSIFSDLGQLHSLAGAIAIGPGVLVGHTFIGALSWPLSKVVSFPARSAGVFIVEELLGFGKRQERWGFNASLIGDAYLNFGFSGVVVVMLLFGALLKFLYLKFRQGNLHCAIYTLAMLSAVQAFWVSIEVWPQALTTLSFAVFVMVVGNTIFRLRHASI